MPMTALADIVELPNTPVLGGLSVEAPAFSRFGAAVEHIMVTYHHDLLRTREFANTNFIEHHFA